MLATALSVIALALSAYAVWRTHLRPASLDAVVSPLSLRVYPFDRAGHHWVVPAFHVTLAFTNDGARPGTVEDIRLVVEYPELDGIRETFAPLTLQDGPMGFKHETTHDRSARLGTEPEWMPVVVPPGETVTRHVEMTSGAWDWPPIGSLKLTMHFKAPSHDWQVIESWSQELAAKSWHFTYGGMPSYAVRSTSEPDPAPRAPEFSETFAPRARSELGEAPFDELRTRIKERNEEAAKVRRDAGEE